MTPKQWRDKVGQYVEQRRKELGYSANKAAALTDDAVSPSLWRQVERGERHVDGKVAAPNPAPRRRAAMCKALGWTPDSIDRLLAGQEPQIQPDTSQVPPVSAPAAQTDSTTETLSRLVERLYSEVSTLRSELAALQIEVAELRDVAARHHPDTQ